MPTEVNLHQVQQLLATGAQLVDVLPAAEYEAAHIAGAINLPLKNLNQEAAIELDADRPVIVYCHDFQ